MQKEQHNHENLSLQKHRMAAFEFQAKLDAVAETYDELLPFFSDRGCWFDQDNFEEILDELEDFQQNHLCDCPDCGLKPAILDLQVLIEALQDLPQLMLNIWQSRIAQLECVCCLNQPDNFIVDQPDEEMLSSLFANGYDQSKARLLCSEEPQLGQSLLIWSGKGEIAVTFKDQACVITEDQTNPQEQWIGKFIELAQQIEVIQQQ
ncbi:hypothetical protein [uncultured Ferrimonas sp.]|uniref:hypothetical protein n=1 Tax=uncultured Ferrimonas sp. TaxID=432640 RepID=UPI002636C287|nr:hypothetical protein [uncultured Ferrimonas sp.]